MKQIVFKAAVCLSLSSIACSAAFAAPPPPNLQQFIRDQVGLQLLDGSTAQYRWPDYNPKGTVYVTYCGFVNAKNAYGGYVGFRPFKIEIILDSKKDFDVMGKPLLLRPSVDMVDDIMYNHVKESCLEAGIDISKTPPR